MKVDAPRLMIAAPASGSGKTTFVCALLRAMIRRGKRCASFKCGPDYIDPMFHRESVGTCRSANLDLFFSGGDGIRELLARESRGADLSVLEGVMGFYDGIAAGTEGSSWDTARVTETPVALLVNGRGQAASLAALVSGFSRFRENSGIRAVVLNNVSAGMFPVLRELLERECGIPVAGYLPPMGDCSLESRHLGLVTAAETRNLEAKLDALAAQAEKTVDLDLLERLAGEAPPLEEAPPLARPGTAVRVALARDEAFCFYYEESLALLEELGAELIPFSPLRDAALPQADALLLGGGYPELHAGALSENVSMRESVAAAVRGGMPAIAECGGFLYLHETLEGEGGARYPMCAVIPAEGFRTGKLGRFGYVTLTARRDNLLCPAGGELRAHEFHYWDSASPGDGFSAVKPRRGTRWDCAHVSETLYAGFPHLYLAGAPEAAARFLDAARRRKKDESDGTSGANRARG